MTAISADAGLPRAVAPISLWPFWALLGGALLVLVATQVMMWPLNGLWLDELFTLEATNPALPFTQNYFEHIAPDTNPPLYPVLLRLVRGIVSDGRAAVMVTASLFLAATMSYIVLTARQAGMLRVGLSLAAAFAMCGPVLSFFPEGRAYFLSMCIAFATSWAAGLDIVTGRRETRLVAYAALGALGALSHIFGAIFAGSLGASLVGYGILSRRRDLRDSGLVLGVSASVVFVVWFSTIQGSMGRVSWLEFTVAAVQEAVWYLRTLTIGPAYMLAPLTVLLAYAFWVKQTRPLVIVMGVTFALFAALPLAASFFVPMIVGRYWTVGAPALVLLLVLVAWTLAQRSGRNARWAVAATCLVLAATSSFGVSNALTFVMDKPVWRGAPMGESFGKGCPVGSIRLSELMVMNGVTQITSLPRETFMDASSAGTPDRAVTDITCPVVGWSEHFYPVDGSIDAMPDSLLLARLHLTGRPEEVTIIRHRTGYVVFKAGFFPPLEP